MICVLAGLIESSIRDGCEVESASCQDRHLHCPEMRVVVRVKGRLTWS